MEVIFNIRFRAQEVIWGCVHWTETNLAMRLKPQDTVFFWQWHEFCPEPSIY